MNAAGRPWPQELQLNAWADGLSATTPVDRTRLIKWTFDPRGERIEKMLFPERPADLADWAHPDVGWGLVLPEAPRLSNADAAAAVDAPAPIRKLLDSRPGSPVLRYRKQTRHTHLLRHDGPKGEEPVVLSGSERGTQPGALPQYLLIYGGPDAIPWQLQYLLNQTAAVGRLTLTGEPLERYVDSLMSGWRDAGSQVTATTTWAVIAGDHDVMGRLMRDVVADPVHRKLAGDEDLGPGATFLDGAAAPVSGADLIAKLAELRPGLVVTTSHGFVDARSAPAGARRTVGLPVGAEGRPLDLAALLDAWQPDGAIWYAHACSSAGVDDHSFFDGALEEGSSAKRVTDAFAALGPAVAPLPEALLGADKPARAFIGHVEPTMDWTISHPVTKQPLTASILDALYTGLFQPWPVGHAFRACYRHVGELFAARDQAYRSYNEEGVNTEAIALATQLAALDRQSVVIFGDPTVALTLPA